MVTMRLIRLEENFKYGTFGIWIIQSEVFCVTLEPADIMNKRNISSIPAQQYECKRINSPTHGETFRVWDVPDRDGINLHPGNELEDTEGCIIMASSYAKLKTGNRIVANSGVTFTRFMQLTQNLQAFHLTIKEHY